MERLNRVASQFFRDLGEDEVDEYRSQYLAGVLESLQGEEEEDVDLESFRDLIGGLSERYFDLSEKEQSWLALELLQQTGPGLAKPPPPPLPVLPGPRLQAASHDRSSSDGGGSDCPTAASTAAADEAVATLQALAGAEVCAGFLRDVLGREGSLQAAASWLVDCEDLGAAQRPWEAAQAAAAAAQEQEAREREANRKKIVQRFQLEVVPGGDGGKGGKDPRALAAWQPGAKDAAAAKAGAGKVRFRDGMAVASKGEKFIVETVREEWNGGSSGKVYTKGKRGKGFV